VNHALLTAALLALFLVSGNQASGQAPKGALVVTVFGADGKPLEGAELFAWNDDESRSLRTDEAGRAVLRKLSGRPVTVIVAASGHVGDERYEVRIPDTGEISLEFRLVAGIPFEGRIVDHDGAPVAGAYIEVMAGGTFEGASSMYSNHAPWGRVWTAKDGRFRVHGIPKDAIATLIVIAEGYGEARVGVKVFGDSVRPSPLVIRLERGASVSGAVRAPDGRPLAGAVVFVVPADAETLRENPRVVSMSTRGGTLRALTARTGATGRFEVKGIALGRAYVAMAEADGFARSEVSAELRATADRPAVEVDLRVRHPSTLVLRLEDAEGKPFDGAKVRIGGIMSWMEKEKSDGGGAYRFARLAPGKLVVKIEAKGFLDLEVEIEVAEGKTVERTVRLDAGVAIEGVLLDEKGRPKAGIVVEASPTDLATRGGSLTEARTETDAQGRFRLAGLRRIPYELDAWAKGFKLLEKVTLAAPATDVCLRGAHLGVLRMRFRAPEGSSIPTRAMVWRWREGGGGGSGSDIVDGVLEEIGFDGGNVKMTVHLKGYVMLRLEVTVKPGETKDLGEIVLDPGRDLHGRAVDLDGKPVAGALVDHGGYTEATTDADGRFLLRHLPAGEIDVTVDADGFLGLEEKVEVGTDEARAVLRLHRGTVLCGILRDGEGEELGDYWLQILRPVPGQVGVWKNDDDFGTEEDGTFEERVKAGRCRIAFIRERGAEPIVLFEGVLREGETRKLKLVL
jgi:Carboxypeptidase regulatory-like domain